MLTDKLLLDTLLLTRTPTNSVYVWRVKHGGEAQNIIYLRCMGFILYYWFNRFYVYLSEVQFCLFGDLNIDLMLSKNTITDPLEGVVQIQLPVPRITSE